MRSTATQWPSIPSASHDRANPAARALALITPARSRAPGRRERHQARGDIQRLPGKAIAFSDRTLDLPEFRLKPGSGTFGLATGLDRWRTGVALFARLEEAKKYENAPNQRCCGALSACPRRSSSAAGCCHHTSGGHRSARIFVEVTAGFRLDSRRGLNVGTADRTRSSSMSLQRHIPAAQWSITGRF
jgi:hypothetical protein